MNIIKLQFMKFLNIDYIIFKAFYCQIQGWLERVDWKDWQMEVLKI